MKAHEFLEAGLQHMKDRAKTYDNPQGERSIGKTVSAFNAITGHTLTEEQGWMFMALLKIVRSQQGEYKRDNYEDLSSYSGLMGEAAFIERVVDKDFLETAIDDTSWSQVESEERIRKDWHTCCNSLYAEGYRYVFKTADSHVYASPTRPKYVGTVGGWKVNPHCKDKKPIPINIVPKEYADKHHSESLLFLPLTSNPSAEAAKEDSKKEPEKSNPKPTAEGNEQIPWDKIPEIWQWFARDQVGVGYLYRYKPSKGQYCWQADNKPYIHAKRYDIPNSGPVENWEDILYQRPSKHPFSDVPGGRDEQPF